MSPLKQATDTFLREPLINTSKGPHSRDAIDVKRWMFIVVVALLPCLVVAIWNTGVQSLVYSSSNYKLMNEYLSGNYWDFVMKENRWLEIIQLGLIAVVPIIFISYAVGGACEAVFAAVRGHE